MTRASNTEINFIIFILKFVVNCLKFDATHDFSVWLRTDLIQCILIGFEAVLKKNITSMLMLKSKATKVLRTKNPSIFFISLILNK